MGSEAKGQHVSRGNARGPSARGLVDEAVRLEHAGRVDDAIGVLREGLSRGDLRAGQAADARLMLSRILLNAHRPKAAVAELVEVLRVDAHRPDALILLVEGLLACGELARAETILARARQSGADRQRLDELEARMRFPDTLDQSTVPIPPSLMAAASGGPSFRDEDEETQFDDLWAPVERGPAGLMFHDDEQTVPWEREAKPPVSRAIVEEDAVWADFDMMEEAITENSKAIPALEPRSALGLRIGQTGTGKRPAPLHKGWSVGDPSRGRIITSPRTQVPPPDDLSTTGSFREVSRNVLEKVDQQLDQFKARGMPRLGSAYLAQVHAPDDEVVTNPVDARQGPFVADPAPHPDAVRRHSPAGTGPRRPSPMTPQGPLPLSVLPSDLLPRHQRGTPIETNATAAATPVSKLLQRAESDDQLEMIDIDAIAEWEADAPTEVSQVGPSPSPLSQRLDRMVPPPSMPPRSIPPPGFYQGGQDLGQPPPSNPRSNAAGFRPPEAAQPAPPQIWDAPVPSAPQPVWSPPSVEARPPVRSAPQAGPPPAWQEPQAPPAWQEPQAPPARQEPLAPPAWQEPAPPPTLPPRALAPSAPVAPRPVAPVEARPAPPEPRRAAQPEAQPEAPPRPTPPAARPRAEVKPRVQPRPRQGAADVEDVSVSPPPPSSRERSRKAPKPARTGRRGIGVVAVFLVLGLAGIGVLVIYPWLHYVEVLDGMETHLPRANAGRSQDTYRGYCTAADSLNEAIHAQGLVEGRPAEITDDYLLLLGLNEHQQKRERARAELAEIYALLWQRYGDDTREKAEALIQGLDADGYRSPYLTAAKTYLRIGTGDLSGARQLLESENYAADANLNYLTGLTRDLAGDHDGAAQYYQTAIQQDPTHLPTVFALGRTWAAKHDARARDYFNQVLVSSPNHIEASVEQSLFLVEEQRDLNEARDRLHRVVNELSGDASPMELSMAHYALGLFNRERYHDRPNLAEEQFKKALELNPHSIAVICGLTRLYLDTDRLEDAEGRITAAMEQHKDNQTLVRLQAELLLRRSRPEAAIKLVDAPGYKDASSKTLLGHILVEMGDFKGANDAFDEALKRDPAMKRMGLDQDLLMTEAALGRGAALTSLQAAFETTETAPNAWRLARALEARSDPKRAMAYYEIAHKLDKKGEFRFFLPPSADACRVAVGRYAFAEADRWCATAVGLRPAHLPPQLAFGQLALLRGDYLKANRTLEEAVQQHPDSVAPLVLLTRSQIMLGSLSAAQANLDKLGGLVGDTAEFQALHGLLDFQGHDFEHARGWLDKALQAERKAGQSEPETRLVLAWCHLKTGNSAAAASLLDRELTRHPYWGGPALIAVSEFHRKGNWRVASQRASQGLSAMRRAEVPAWRMAEGYTALALAFAERYGLADDRSAKWLVKAIEVYDAYAPALYHLARIEKADGNDDKAIAYLQIAVDADSRFCKAVDMLKAYKDARKDDKIEVPTTCGNGETGDAAKAEAPRRRRK